MNLRNFYLENCETSMVKTFSEDSEWLKTVTYVCEIFHNRCSIGS